MGICLCLSQFTFFFLAQSSKCKWHTLLPISVASFPGLSFLQHLFPPWCSSVLSHPKLVLLLMLLGAVPVYLWSLVIFLLSDLLVWANFDLVSHLVSLSLSSVSDLALKGQSQLVTSVPLIWPSHHPNLCLTNLRVQERELGLCTCNKYICLQNVHKLF